jgi:hypothetical protein
MDLADVLSREAIGSELDFRHVGWEQLKGVFGAHPYPVLWVSVREQKAPPGPPWEDHLCPFSKRANKEKDTSKKTRDDIQDFCRDMRRALPDLELFKPYFEEKNMPERHQKWWTEQEMLAEKQVNENLPVVDVFGDPQPRGTRATAATKVPLKPSKSPAGAAKMPGTAAKNAEMKKTRASKASAKAPGKAPTKSKTRRAARRPRSEGQ